MRTSTIGRRLVLGVAVLASSAATLSTQATAASTTPSGPTVQTGGVAHVRGTSAVLDGSVNPQNAPTTYYFQYGPTIAYGSQTTPAALPAGSTTVKVGQPVTGLLIGYHYRLVATNTNTTIPGVGKDNVFQPKSTSPKFVVTKPEEPSVFGRPFYVTGKLTGTGAANRAIILQSSPYPFLEGFEDIGTATTTNSAGGFSLKAPALRASTQFRVSTLDPRPLYSQIITDKVAVKVTLRVRSTGKTGVVRLYGTVSPAEPGARVAFQLRKSIRPTRSEKTTKFATEYSATVKRAGKTFSRFSSVVTIRTAGRYRAYVQLRKGPLTSGGSSSVLLRAAPGASKHHGKH